eukprot:UN20554
MRGHIYINMIMKSFSLNAKLLLDNFSTPHVLLHNGDENSWPKQPSIYVSVRFHIHNDD